MKTKAAVLWGLDQKWEVEEVDLDGPKEAEVLVKLTASGQSAAGGWTYVPGMGDEGSVTVTQMQGLRAAAVVAVVPQVTGYRKLLSNVRQRP